MSGKDYYRSTLELNLPPVRFRNVGSPGFYLTHMRTALFAGGLVTNPDDGALRGEYANVGIQFDFKIMVMHRLSMTLSIGYSQGYIYGHSADDEWMLSLKIL